MAARVGLWMVGAWGGVATTVATGLSALRQGLTEPMGLVTAQEPFTKLPLAGWDDFVIGGHDIRDTTYAAEANVLWEKSRVFSPGLLQQVAEDFAVWDQNIRPGVMVNVGERIKSFAGPKTRAFAEDTPLAAITRIRRDLEEFQVRHALDRVVVVNVASTEPPPESSLKSMTWPAMKSLIDSGDHCPIPSSTLYAIAAFESGCAHVNFTPSVGTDLPALNELALERKVVHCGRDGKTGETLLKSVLGPMFAARNLHVNSWVGHNIFGNMDGKVLDDPANKANKVQSKDHLLTEILGYKPQTLVSIEYIESLGDWKTAWDHIHFEGFLGTKMAMQFTWQGCDSLLAAPLVLDLVRLTEFEARSGSQGLMTFLGSFFKSPMGCSTPEFAAQYRQLVDWAESRF
ncbi:MAG: myo-inositol-1-phosphate synthase [Planctomyces sp.]|nr:myo-inositol-1-phosphate synthase [Planctomyces sp.]